MTNATHAVLLAVLCATAVSAIRYDYKRIATAAAVCPNNGTVTAIYAKWTLPATPSAANAPLTNGLCAYRASVGVEKNGDVYKSMAAFSGINGSRWDISISDDAEMYITFSRMHAGTHYRNNGSFVPAGTNPRTHKPTKKGFKMLVSPIDPTGDGLILTVDGQEYTTATVVFDAQVIGGLDMECKMFPPGNAFTFEDITVECGGKVTEMKWVTTVQKHRCNIRAEVLDAKSVALKWDSTA
jgi:hypothetical protein